MHNTKFPIPESTLLIAPAGDLGLPAILNVLDANRLHLLYGDPLDDVQEEHRVAHFGDNLRWGSPALGANLVVLGEAKRVPVRVGIAGSLQVVGNLAGDPAGKNPVPLVRDDAVAEGLAVLVRLDQVLNEADGAL
eukprot:CAMPEP_0196664432 /NCGR_PEP_ID=MMETSP1086-20130531/57143_1 /TAXON_ID=77921 /ORGANISM="Cyanoptyche  gloeocystis , Strain SAG4.97" /LENGTH=134 /DNA_ID=CAMNT_0042000741 /DNA_START=484 /DNA_END=885 /DNA_ORIENTATION=-